MSENSALQNENTYAYHILRYTSDVIRDEWVNIGVLLFDPATGERRIRLIEEEAELRRIHRLRPLADVDVLRGLKEHMEDRFETFLQQGLAENGHLSPAEHMQKLVQKWDETLSTGLQLSPQKGVHADDLDAELERLYGEHVALPPRGTRIGSANSRADMRKYCSQVWKLGGLWDKLEKSVRVGEFTCPGDPMRLDYSYRHNGTRGFVQTLSVSRTPADSKLYAYTAQRIASRAPFGSEFAAVTDVALEPGNERHRFVRDTLRDAGIEPVPMEGFAVWVAKLKPSLQ